MELEADEKKFLNALAEYGEELYGEENFWVLLEENELPLPEQGFLEEFREILELDLSIDEEKTLESLQEKNLLIIQKKDLESGAGAAEEDEFWRSKQEKKFLGLNGELLERLRQR